MKSHLQSYPCPLQINSFWNLGFLLGITIILQIITGIFLGLHYTSDLNSAYSSVFHFFTGIPTDAWLSSFLLSSSSFGYTFPRFLSAGNQHPIDGLIFSFHYWCSSCPSRVNWKLMKKEESRVYGKAYGFLVFLFS